MINKTAVLILLFSVFFLQTCNENDNEKTLTFKTVTSNAVGDVKEITLKTSSYMNGDVCNQKLSISYDQENEKISINDIDVSFGYAGGFCYVYVHTFTAENIENGSFRFREYIYKDSEEQLISLNFVELHIVEVDVTSDAASK